MGRIEVIIPNKMLQGFTGQLMLSTVGDVPPWTDEKWTWYSQLVEKIGSETGPYTGALMFSDQAVPTAKQRDIQRKEAPNTMANMKYTTMLTDSALVRGAGTALSWINKTVNMKMYKPTDYLEAFTWIGEHVKFDRKEAVQMFEDMMAQVGASANIR